MEISPAGSFRSHPLYLALPKQGTIRPRLPFYLNPACGSVLRGGLKVRTLAIRALPSRTGCCPVCPVFLPSFFFTGILLNDLIFTPDLPYSNLSPYVVPVTPRGRQGSLLDLEALHKANQLSGWSWCTPNRRDHPSTNTGEQRSRNPLEAVGTDTFRMNSLSLSALCRGIGNRVFPERKYRNANSQQTISGSSLDRTSSHSVYSPRLLRLCWTFQTDTRRV